MNRTDVAARLKVAIRHRIDPGYRFVRSRGSRRREVQERRFERALVSARQADLVTDVLHRVLVGRPATPAEMAQARLRGRQGTPLMDMAHELRAGDEGARVTVHQIAPALRTYMRGQFDSGTGRSEEPRLVYLHFMRVGGTSMSRLLGGWFGPERSRVHLFLDDVALMPPQVLANLRVIGGHLPYTALELIPGSFQTMAVLRDPIGRTLSHFSHLKAVNPSYRKLTLEEFVFDEVYELSGNFQARQLAHDMDLAGAWRSWSPEHLVDASGGDPGVEHPLASLFDSGPMDLSGDDLLRVAAANLERIDVVGVTDDLDSVARRAAEVMGAPPASVGRLNGSPAIDPSAIDTRIRRRIEERTAVDRELYDLARRRAAST